ncbi:hypothetical protein P280DRAFT_482822 [Massarina eburnea CBS 473.64]|uniref:Uncharacterized protein n=1 Tax=Massarina eburnea CBS 473.64 TaxID=1395130 RepID=A0A6A6RSZ0_9PLEO|nr:hypothetical protein P280DRAFT_482822 [Massarina eburnea CBS 473.64]
MADGSTMRNPEAGFDFFYGSINNSAPLSRSSSLNNVCEHYEKAYSTESLPPSLSDRENHSHEHLRSQPYIDFVKRSAISTETLPFFTKRATTNTIKTKPSFDGDLRNLYNFPPQSFSEHFSTMIRITETQVERLEKRSAVIIGHGKAMKDSSHSDQALRCDIQLHQSTLKLLEKRGEEYKTLFTMGRDMVKMLVHFHELKWSSISVKKSLAIDRLENTRMRGLLEKKEFSRGSLQKTIDNAHLYSGQLQDIQYSTTNLLSFASAIADSFAKLNVASESKDVDNKENNNMVLQCMAQTMDLISRTLSLVKSFLVSLHLVDKEMYDAAVRIMIARHPEGFRYLVSIVEMDMERAK